MPLVFLSLLQTVLEPGLSVCSFFTKLFPVALELNQLVYESSSLLQEAQKAAEILLLPQSPHRNHCAG